jgi:hypothetical protein
LSRNILYLCTISLLRRLRSTANRAGRGSIPVSVERSAVTMTSARAGTPSVAVVVDSEDARRREAMMVGATVVGPANCGGS